MNANDHTSRNIDVVATIAAATDALREELHHTVADMCRPALTELREIVPGTRLVVTMSPRTSPSILCVPALLTDDYRSESDMVRWLPHSGGTHPARARIEEAVRTILKAVSLIEASGLAPAPFRCALDEDDQQDEEDEGHDGSNRLAEPVTDENGLASLSLAGWNGNALRLSDSSLAYPDALRVRIGPESILATRPQIASILPALLRFVRTGSIRRTTP